MERARAIATRLDASLAIIDKRRVGPNVVAEMNIIGEVKDQVAILLDDMIDTAGTLALAADALKHEGAKKFSAAVLTPCFPDPRFSESRNRHWRN